MADRATAERSAYRLIKWIQPAVLESVHKLLSMGQTPTQIADAVASRDVALAGLVELAASYMSSEGDN